MNQDQFVAVMDLIGRATNRVFDERDLTIWDAVIGSHPHNVVEAALLHLISTSTDFLTPARLNQEVGRLAQARVAQAGPPDVPSGLDVGEYREFMRNFTLDIIEGLPRDAAQQAALTAIGRPLTALPRNRRAPEPQVRNLDAGDAALTGTIVEHPGPAAASAAT